MFGGILGVMIGIGAILLGMKGFTAAGLPLTKKSRIQGKNAKVLGVICIVCGLIFIALDTIPLYRMTH